MIYDKLTAILTDRLGISEEDITPETSLIEDLAADSLDLYELMMALEEEFNVEIPQELANDIVYVEDIVRVLKELGVEE